MVAGKRTAERGGALYIVLIAIILLAALTWAVSKSSEQQTNMSSSVQIDNQISRMTAQAALLAGALQQMVANGEDPLQLPTNLSTVRPGDTGWDTAPNNYKIYHPYGGGVKYMASTGSGTASDTTNLATNFQISPGSIVKGVGATDTVPDILFLAVVNSASACQRINTLLGVPTTLPVLSNAAYTNLFVTVPPVATTLSVAGGTCTSGCDNVARSCVQNTSGNAWGYYQVLLPQ